MFSINDMPPYLDYFHMTSTDANSGLFYGQSTIGSVASAGSGGYALVVFWLFLVLAWPVMPGTEGHFCRGDCSLVFAGGG